MFLFVVFCLWRNPNKSYGHPTNLFIELKKFCFHISGMAYFHSVTHSLKTADLRNSLSRLTVPAVPVLSVWQASAHTWDKNTRTFAGSRGASGERGDPIMPFVKPCCRQQERNLTTPRSLFRNNIKRPPPPPGTNTHALRVERYMDTDQCVDKIINDMVFWCNA